MSYVFDYRVEENIETAQVAPIITTNIPTLVTPQNWQPPAPIFPHMGQVS